MSGLSIVIPLFNEKKNLKRLVQLIRKSILIKNYEIILIDDDSYDGSKQVLKNLQKNYKKVKFFIRKKKPRDLSRSCVMGFLKSKYENILVMDGDLQHNPREINKLYNTFQKYNCDVVVGSRELFLKKNTGLKFYRLVSSIILILLVNLFLGFKTTDPMSGFFIFKKKLFLRLKNKLFNKGYKILLDIIYSTQKKIIVRDVFIRFKSRKKGYSKMSFKIIFLLVSAITSKLIQKLIKN